MRRKVLKEVSVRFTLEADEFNEVFLVCRMQTEPVKVGDPVFSEMARLTSLDMAKVARYENVPRGYLDGDGSFQQMQITG